MPDTTPNTDPTGTQTSWLDSAIGNAASWVNHVVSGTPTAGELQAQSAALDQQLMNGVPGTNFGGDYAQYAPGGSVYKQILDSRGQAAADAAWQSVSGDLSAQVAYTNAIPGQIGQAAEAGAQQGLDNVFAGVQGLPGKFLGLLGYQWLIVAAIALFFWLGGAVFLRNKLTKTK